MLRLLATFALGAAAVLQAHAALPPNCTRNATVALGDTCDGISAKYNVSTYQLAAVNTGIIDANCGNLAVDEVICLGLAGHDCNTTHVVKTGDSCASIAGANNITEDTLITNNPNLNRICTNLYPTEVLCVASKIYVNLTGSV